MKIENFLQFLKIEHFLINHLMQNKFKYLINLN